MICRNRCAASPLATASYASFEACSSERACPPKRIIWAARAIVTLSRSSGAWLFKNSMHSRISRAFPMARPSGCSISVINTTILVFIARQTSTMERERLVAAFSVGINAPEPVLTSITRPSIPSASFLLKMLAVISGIDSTVAVTSRSA